MGRSGLRHAAVDAALSGGFGVVFAIALLAGAMIWATIYTPGLVALGIAAAVYVGLVWWRQGDLQDAAVRYTKALAIRKPAG